MIYSRLPSNEWLLDFAEKIGRLHKDHASSRPCVDDNNFLGLLGERQWAYLTGGEMDLRLLPGGDGHVDSRTDFRDGRFPVDVKVARKPFFLLVDQNYMHELDPNKRHIFILGKLIEPSPDPLTWDAELLRWDWDSKLRQSTPRDVGGHGIISYWRKFKDCRDIYELLALTNRQWSRGA